MSEQGPEQTKSDPTAPLIDFYDTWVKSWAGAMSEVVASKSFADSMSRQIESSLEMTSLVRRQVNELMEHYLRQLSLPARSEVISLAERLTKIELRVDDLDAKLDEALDLLKAMQPRPTRRKKA